MNYPKPASAVHDNSLATLKDHLKMLIYKNHFFSYCNILKSPRNTLESCPYYHCTVSSGPTSCSHCSTNTWAPLMLAVTHSFVSRLHSFVSRLYLISKAKNYLCDFKKHCKSSSFRALQFAHLIWHWLLTFSLYKFIRAGPAPQSMDQLIWNLPSENTFDSLITIPCTIIYT